MIKTVKSGRRLQKLCHRSKSRDIRLTYDLQSAQFLRKDWIIASTFSAVSTHRPLVCTPRYHLFCCLDGHRETMQVIRMLFRLVLWGVPVPTALPWEAFRELDYN